MEASRRARARRDSALLVFFVYATRHIKPEHVPERRAKPRTWWGKTRGLYHELRTYGRSPRHRTKISRARWLCRWSRGHVSCGLSSSPPRPPTSSIPHAGSLACLLGINVGLIVRATPGNVGFFQFVYALTAGEFGVAQNDAIAVSLLIQTIQILPLTLLGIALAPEFIFRRGKKDKETEQVAKKIEEVRQKHHGPLSTAEEVLQRADKAGVAPPPPPRKS